MTVSRREAYLRSIEPHRIRAADIEWTAFDRFCRALGIVASPASAILYLTAHEHEGSRAVGRRLTRLDLASYVRGAKAPGQSTEVRRYLKALQATHPLGAPVPKADPLYVGHVRALVEAIAAPSWSQLRDVAYVVLLQASGLRPEEVERLTWSDVRISNGRVVVTTTLRKSRVIPIDVAVELLANGKIDCPVQALRDLRRASPIGDRLIFATRGAHLKNRRLRSLAREITRHRMGPQVIGQRTVDARTMRRLVTEILQPPLLAIRDMAIVLIGFGGALSTDEAINLRIEDVTTSSRGLVIDLPQRPQRSVAIPVATESQYCAQSAWQRWVDAVRRLEMSHDGLPAFMPCDPTQPILQHRPLWDGALSDVVARHARTAGLEGRYGFSSLRDGFIRSALQTPANPYDIQRQTGFRVFNGVQRRRDQEQLLSRNVARLLGL